MAQSLTSSTTPLSLPNPSLLAPASGGLLAGVRLMWRLLVWGVLFTVVLAAWVAVRLDVQRLNSDLDRSMRTERQARLQQERLHLELASRMRAQRLHATAEAVGAVHAVPLVDVEVPR